ncbi:uncharacterized protein Dyak_GE29189 [Drosophila yakuba]|uniref:Uncharacterized protein n=1 Tax=Drosophila yakuba TaxID=7245 RepID=A0A0R1DVZ1_DROYA|nr:uncharacterized protein Dyak_GE29189 [Drosophila yakuba]
MSKHQLDFLQILLTLELLPLPSTITTPFRHAPSELGASRPYAHEFAAEVKKWRLGEEASSARVQNCKVNFIRPTKAGYVKTV